MGRQIRPARIYQAVSQELTTKVLPGYAAQEPPWFQVMRDIPPSEILTRPVTVQKRPNNHKLRKPSNIYKPPRITHPEDGLRATFYRDHPWELARPRIILESDGKDAQRCNWAKGLRQPGLPLTGECVVQRQLWLMQNAGLKRDQAYDVARKEFYALRQEEEIEKRVAREEARHVGAYFGKNRLQISMDLEDKEFETWKGWAGKRTAALEQQGANYATYGEEADAEAAPESTLI
ncbi:37S ribosomal protein Rsm25 [Colletotrichum graminicola]|uniref:37S ribosomal protein S25, mitochondrial n=1 Tax=Colletotrichum graminicola (strain M1.001 / M2 / FGSC 10212) TaxID=645133 RepID=E3QVF3_COLGM|nr:37S ribosomal protein Rsm25 [Colletotrichum graminicola M1.001]EFQ34841.1 37S ribosomal protein Rsm25 [Colletotrichum graminicola M1.001]WDK10354.1 37S ribosomal protein Rsm25 [Colletotrichum graminicola]